MATEDHADKNAKNKAVLHRRGNTHRVQGHAHISGDPGRKRVYDNIQQIRFGLKNHKPRPIKPRDRNVEPWSAEHAQNYKFSFFQPSNAKTPYKNQAQHIIPIEFFSPDMLGDDELIVMRKVEYNVNNGENIIFLPEVLSKVYIHGLPYHCGAHPVYNKAVKSEGSKLRKNLQKAIKKDKDHKEWKPPEDIASELKDLQKALWNLTVKMVKAGMLGINEFNKRKINSGAGG